MSELCISREQFDRMVKSAEILDDVADPMTFVKLLALLSLAGGGTGLLLGGLGPSKPAPSEAMRTAIYSLLLGPAGGLGHALGRKLRYSFGGSSAGEELNETQQPGRNEKQSMAKTASSVLWPLFGLLSLMSLLQLGSMGGGYLVGRHGPDVPEEPGRNENLYAALMSTLPVIGSPMALGYGMGRDTAINEGRRKKQSE